MLYERWRIQRRLLEVKPEAADELAAPVKDHVQFGTGKVWGTLLT